MIGRIGIWCRQLRRGDLAQAVRAVQEIEALGFAVAWLPGGEAGLEQRLRALLDATKTLVIATGIVNIWEHSAGEVAVSWQALEAAHPGRLLLGLGIGHAPLVDATQPGRFRSPFAAIGRYLDELDSPAGQVPVDRRVLAALGPQMVELGARRTAGVHPYLVTPGHTRSARARLGPGPLLAPEQHLVLESDGQRARELARDYLATYWRLPSYRANFRRMGFNEEDIADGGSDRLVDALVAWGEPDAILDRVRQHHEAGADHVCLQVLTADRQEFPVAGWRALAAAVFGRS